MPSMNITWKGYPHNRLPRIRLPSRYRSSSHGRHTSRLRAIRELLSSPLWHRGKKHFRVRKRSPLSRSSRISTPTLEIRRRVSQRARHSIQASFWNHVRHGTHNRSSAKRSKTDMGPFGILERRAQYNFGQTVTFAAACSL